MHTMVCARPPLPATTWQDQQKHPSMPPAGPSSTWFLGLGPSIRWDVLQQQSLRPNQALRQIAKHPAQGVCNLTTITQCPTHEYCSCKTKSMCDDGPGSSNKPHRSRVCRAASQLSIHPRTKPASAANDAFALPAMSPDNAVAKCCGGTVWFTLLRCNDYVR